MTPLTTRQQQLISKNILAACKDITKLNKSAYNFLNTCSGFIAHYDLNGFIAHYSDCSLEDDINQNYVQNQWRNFREGDRGFEYYRSKRECYNMILGGLVANDVQSFMRSHFQVIHIG